MSAKEPPSISCPKCGKANRVETLSEDWITMNCIYCGISFDYRFDLSKSIARISDLNRDNELDYQ